MTPSHASGCGAGRQGKGRLCLFDSRVLPVVGSRLAFPSQPGWSDDRQWPLVRRSTRGAAARHGPVATHRQLLLLQCQHAVQHDLPRHRARLGHARLDRGQRVLHVCLGHCRRAVRLGCMANMSPIKITPALSAARAPALMERASMCSACKPTFGGCAGHDDAPGPRRTGLRSQPAARGGQTPRTSLALRCRAPACPGVGTLRSGLHDRCAGGLDRRL